MVLQVKFLPAGFKWCHTLHSLENNCTVVHTLSKYTEIPNTFSAALMVEVIYYNSYAHSNIYIQNEGGTGSSW